MKNSIKKTQFLKYSMALLLLLCTFLGYAQDGFTVSGTIVDNSGIPLGGASILEKGTTNGGQSDFDGNFTLEVANENVTLVISYLGFSTQEIALNGQPRVAITLNEDAANLDEVIVVGYGTQKRSDLTGAVERADLASFRNQPNTSIVQSLQGTTPGLNVGAVTSAGENPSLSVRGRNTFATDSNGNPVDISPLIVLDGIIYRGNIVDINPNDVASVDILKDASSKAIYGSQAANGVLLITTRGGKRNVKPSYSVSTYYSAQTPANTLTSERRGPYLEKLSDIFWDDAFLAPDFTTPNPDFDVLDILVIPAIQDGILNGTETDWVDLVSQSAYISETNLSMSGGSEKTSYFVSAGYTDQQTFIKNDEYNRVNVRVNIDTDVTDWLKLGMNAFVSSSDYSGIAASYRNALVFSPVIDPFNEDGTLNLFPHIGNDINPLASLDTENDDKRINLFGAFYANIDVPFIKGLTYRLNYSTNYRTQRFAQFNPYAENQLGAAFKFDTATQDRTLDNILTYKRDFGDRHSLDVTFVSGFEERSGDETRAESAIFLNQTLGFNSLQLGDAERQTVESRAFEETSIYQSGRINYKYDDKYLITGTVRRDGFSGFGTDDKIGVFPSLALGWVASNEKFIADKLPWIDNLKFRASYGASGNRTVGRYRTLARIDADFRYVFGDGGSAAYGQNISSLANNNLGWETTTGWNLGMDFSIFKNKLRGSFNFYDNKTEDILVDVNIPRITGFPSIPTNIGEVANQGFEFSLTSVNMQTDNFDWRTTFNFSTNKNEIVSILGRDDDGDGQEDDLIANGLFIGESIGSIYGYNITGIYQVGDTDIPDGFTPGMYRIEDRNADGLITALDDRQILGRTEPAYRFSILNQFNYKNWKLSAFINSVQGGKDGYRGFNTPHKDEGAYGLVVVNEFNLPVELDYWSPRNPNSDYTGLRDRHPVNPDVYRDRSFVRLQDVNLSYTFDNLFKGSLEVFLSGKNLYTWTNWVGVDPETGAGFRTTALPVMKSYTLGLNLNF